jgi:hypothetical protein
MLLNRSLPKFYAPLRNRIVNHSEQLARRLRVTA